MDTQLKNNRIAAALALLIEAGEKRIERGEAAADVTLQDVQSAAAGQQPIAQLQTRTESTTDGR